MLNAFFLEPYATELDGNKSLEFGAIIFHYKRDRDPVDAK